MEPATPVSLEKPQSSNFKMTDKKEFNIKIAEKNFKLEYGISENKTDIIFKIFEDNNDLISHYFFF